MIKVALNMVWLSLVLRNSVTGDVLGSFHPKVIGVYREWFEQRRYSGSSSSLMPEVREGWPESFELTGRQQ